MRIGLWGAGVVMLEGLVGVIELYGVIVLL